MKTLILEKPGSFKVADASAPSEPGENCALVRVRKIGVCGTDLHAYRGRQPFFTYPRILGHELGVEVVAVGANDRGIAVGDLCAVEPYLNCGDCIACRRGKPNCCTSLKVLGVHVDGGMREVIEVPVDKLHVSKTLKLEQLALVETLGIGAHAVRRTQPEAGEQVLVIGAGPIGLSVVQFALLAGAKVYVLDINAGRLAFCKQHFAVEGVLGAEEANPESVAAALGGDLPTAVFDATGNPQSMESAFQYVASGGRLTLVGLVQGKLTFEDPEFHRREMTLLATRNSTAADFHEIIARMESGEIDTTPWITHQAKLEDVVGTFASWLEPDAGVVKAMIDCP